MRLVEDLGMIISSDGNKNKVRFGIYECPICNKHFKTRTGNVKSGKSTKCKSCAIKIKNTTHGDTGIRLHGIWRGMHQRCYDSNHKAYEWYGGKGVSICGEWKGSYTNFREWAMGSGYADNLTIDRIDSDKDYSPDNCQWITKSENIIRSNTRDNYGKNKRIKISHNMINEICAYYRSGEFTQTQIANKLGISCASVSNMIKKYYNG